MHFQGSWCGPQYKLGKNNKLTSWIYTAQSNNTRHTKYSYFYSHPAPISIMLSPRVHNFGDDWWKTLHHILPGQFTITANQPRKQNQNLRIQVLQFAKDIRFTGVGGTSGRWWPTWHLQMCNVHRTNGLSRQYFYWSYLIWMLYPCPYHLSPYYSHLLSFLSLLSCCRHHESPHLTVRSPKRGLNSQSSFESHCWH